MYFNSSVKEAYNEESTDTYDMDGTIYTVTSKADYGININVGGTVAIDYTCYDSKGEEVEIETGKGVQILGTTEDTMYISVGDEELDLEVLKFLDKSIDKGKTLSISKEEIAELIEKLESYDDIETESESEKETESKNEDESDEDETDSDKEETTTAKKENCVVTFKYNGTIFATQTVKNGSTATRPSFSSSLTGDWDYNFQTPVTNDITVEWK